MKIGVFTSLALLALMAGFGYATANGMHAEARAVVVGVGVSMVIVLPMTLLMVWAIRPKRPRQEGQSQGQVITGHAYHQMPSHYYPGLPMTGTPQYGPMYQLPAPRAQRMQQPQGPGFTYSED